MDGIKLAAALTIAASTAACSSGHSPPISGMNAATGTPTVTGTMTIPPDNYDYLSWGGRYEGGVGGHLHNAVRLKFSSTDPIRGEIRYYPYPDGVIGGYDPQPGSAPVCTATWTETEHLPDGPGPFGEPPSKPSRIVHEQATSGTNCDDMDWALTVTKSSRDGTWSNMKGIPTGKDPNGQDRDRVDSPYGWTEVNFDFNMEKGEVWKV